MARESRRKREEKRFGRPERLADYFSLDRMANIHTYHPDDHEKEWNKQCRLETRRIIDTKVIVADNVSDYALSLDGTGRLAYDKTILNAAPPFPECFVEFRIPERVSPMVRHIGWYLKSAVQGEEPSALFGALEDFRIQDFKYHWVIWGAMTIGTANERVLCPVMPSLVLLDEKGASIQPPYMGLTPGWEGSGQADWARNWAQHSFFTCMLTFCFMNCKNVSLDTVERERDLNRAREKNRLQPFIRYHIINIEPMKQVLRTEGNIEANGLKRALHICCGHFARYVPERGGPFGRKIEEPVMIWHPSHVRGSAKQGVVFSDYNVKAPKDGGVEGKGQSEGMP
jgi:hypothetical protein